MTDARRVRRVEDELGELIERRGSPDAGWTLAELRSYANDPVGFIWEDVLRDGIRWRVPEETALSVRDNRKTAVVGCNGLGKDWIAARIAVWWAYAVGGLAVLTGPTERQVSEVLMRKEVARAKRAGELPGELYTSALRIRGEEASIIAKTASGVSDLTGFHGRRVLGVLTEAQGCDRHVWEALQACTTGPEDRLLAVGNPLTPSGRFYEVAT